MDDLISIRADDRELRSVPDPTPEQVRKKLRTVSWPGFDQDIVAAGFVKEIDVCDGSVRIGFELRTRRMDKAAAIEEGIRQAVVSLPGVELVEIRRIEFEVALIPDVGQDPESTGRGSGLAVAAGALRCGRYHDGSSSRHEAASLTVGFATPYFPWSISRTFTGGGSGCIPTRGGKDLH